MATKFQPVSYLYTTKLNISLSIPSVSTYFLSASILIQILVGVFENFKKNGEFFCFSGQSNQAVTGMFNLYRASQVLFQGEEILEDAKNFSVKFLTEKREANQLLDKWIITKDLPGEVCN